MRFLSLVLVLSVIGCSSEEEKPGGTTGNQCAARGFKCWDNPPLRCIGIYEDVPDPSLKNACGKSVGDGTSDVPCCKLVEEQDTGTIDTGIIDTGVGDTGSGDAATDGTSEVSSDGGDAGDAADAG